MSQNDLSIANQGFASFRSDLNSALQALGSTNSGTSAPSTTYANQLFYDTTNNILKIRNEDNDAFISLFTLDQANDNIESLTINGALTADSLAVDNITIDGTEIDLSSGDLTIDVAGDITIDADGADINFADGGTTFGKLSNSSSNLEIKSTVQDKDIIFKGDDGGSEITAMTIDMSDAGTASFNHDVRVGDNNFLICGAGDDVAIQSDGTNGTIFAGNGNLTLDVAGNITLDADGTVIALADGGTEFAQLFKPSGGGFSIYTPVADSDFKVVGNDGGSTITAMTIDMSAGGTVGIGTSSPAEILHLDSGGSTSTIQIDSDTQSSILFNDHGGSAIAYKIGTNMTDNNGQFELRNHTGGRQVIRVDSSDNVIFGVQTSPTLNATDSDEKFVITSDGDIFLQGAAKVLMTFNRNLNDGTIVLFQNENSNEGSISVSGSTVSFDGFVGRHESSGISTETEKGTVVSTIDELDVYPEKQGEGETEQDCPKAGQTRADHAKVKISDSVGDKRVYGVVDSFTTHDKLMVSSVGIAAVKVTGACEGGDLLESNGDGTAKVQSDDIIRSRTIGKVTIGNSNTGVKLVSCVLYCG